MTYRDSEFDIRKGLVIWNRPDNTSDVMLIRTSKRDLLDLHMIGYVGPAGSPSLYEVLSDMSRDHDEIVIYDSKGNLLHRMEDKDGVHRGTDQEVHGGADPASSGDQSAGALIPSAYTITPGTGAYTYSIGTGLGALYAPGLSFGSSAAVGMNLAYQQQQANLQMQQAQMQMQQAMTVPGSTPGYAFGFPYGVAVNSAEVQRKVIKSEGIRMGEIVAYRCWPIKKGFLWSTAAGRAWAPGEPMKATPDHLKSGIGVFAFKDMSRCIGEFGDEYYNSGEGIAFGTIHIWGEIVEHERGYRAEYADVRSIDFVQGTASRIWHPEYVPNLRKLYKVESNES